MRPIRASRVLALVTGASLLLGVLAPGAAAVPALDVSFEPPRLLLRGETVTFDVAVLDEQRPTGVAYARAGSSRSFTRLRMTWSPGRAQLWARVPARLLTGSILEEYVVLRIPGAGRSVTIPAAGASDPYRTWILDDPSTVKLAQHQFGHLRSPEAIVARANPGNGPGEVGFACPAQGRCAEPTSFDVEIDGTVWVADPANHRLLIWEPGLASEPSRSIPLDYTPLELVVAPDHTVLVRGVKPGVFDSRLFAVDRDGRQRWWADLASDIFNTHLRFGSDGVLYTVVTPWGPWTPVTHPDGTPLGTADQEANVRPDQPISGGGRLVVDHSQVLPPDQLAPRDWRAAVATKGGNLRRTWRITSSNDLDLSLEAVPIMVDGDPLLVFDVWDIPNHVLEHLVVRLAAGGGIRDRFSIGRGSYGGGDIVSEIRIGADGRLYQLLSDPAWGLKIARYGVTGPAPPSEKPSSSPGVSPTPTPSPTPTYPPTATPTPSPSAIAAASGPASSPAVGTPSATSTTTSDEMRLAVVLGIVVLCGALVGFAAWSRRPRRPPSPPGG